MYIKEFNVIYTEKKTDEYRLYICKKSLENQLYRIFELADRNKIAEYIKYFNSLNFKDFYGDFSIDEKYYIVFKHPDGIIARRLRLEKIIGKGYRQGIGITESSYRNYSTDVVFQ